MSGNGSAPTAATPGRLYGVGVGPGDPELLTLKAHRIVTGSPVVACFAARQRPGNAWTIIESLVEPDQTVLRLEYPVTTESLPADRYEQLIADFYDDSAARVAAQLDRGLDVAVVCEGDPFFYGSYMYLHHRLAERYDTTVVPGVTSVSAASAAAGTPLVSTTETLTVLPGVLPPEDLGEALTGCDAAVVMKVGRNLADVREAVTAAGRQDTAVYVERASWSEERIVPLEETDGLKAPYFSLVLLSGTGLARRHRNRPPRNQPSRNEP